VPLSHNSGQCRKLLRNKSFRNGTQNIIEMKSGLGAAGLRILRKLLRKLRTIWMDSLTDMVRGQPASNNIFAICLTNTNF
jgi:hypothetical protein